MRRPSSLKSQSFSQSTLHPVLQAMLGNLDVELDEELARYRRQNGRRGGQTISPRQSAASPRPEPLTPPPIVEASTPIPASTRAGRPHSAAVEADRPSVPAYSQAAYGAAGLDTAGVPLAIASDVEPAPSPLVTFGVPPQSDDELAHPSADAPATLEAEAEAEAEAEDVWGPDAYLESSEHLLQTLADDEIEPQTSQESGMLQSLLTPLGIGSMLLLLLSSVTFGYLLMNPSSMSFLGLGTNQQPSTPNLATGSDGAGAVGAPSSTAGQELSPNLSAQEFPDVNLNTLSTLPKTAASDPTNSPFTGVPQVGTNPSVAARSSPEVDPRSASSAVQATTSAPTSTNTTANSPRSGQSTASNLPPTPRTSSSTARNTATSAQRTRPRESAGAASPTRPASGSPAAASRPPASTATNGRSPSTPTAAPPRVASQPSQPRPRTAAPTVATAPRTPTVAPSSRSSAPDSTAPSTVAPVYYYVVVDFSGDRSLEQARQVVGDAFLRNFSDGAKIQFGRFVDRERAATLARELQSQGVSARVYQP